MLRLFRVSTEDDGLGDSAEFIRGAIDLHHTEGSVVKDDKDMLGGILDLSDVDVEEVMLHRKSMQTIDIDAPIEALINEVFNSRFTRIPLWRDNQDNIVGILHSKHLIRALHEKKGDVTKLKMDELMLEPWFVPESTSLKEQLHAFREKKMHFALVVDEYGDLMGMITLEDILEEVVGQIDDEQDVTKRQVRPLTDRNYLVSGLASIRDVNRELDWGLPDDEATTIAGLVIHESKQIPDVGQVFHFFGYRFEIMRKKRNQVSFLKVR